MHNDTGPRMELRALLAVVLSMVALTVYQYFFVPAPPTEPPLTADAPVSETGPEAPGEIAPDPQADEAPQSVVPTGVVIAEPSARRVTIAAPHYEAVLTNVGGRIESFVLTEYQDDYGRPLDLVHPSARRRDTLLLQLATPDTPRLADAANAALFEVRVEGMPLQRERLEVTAEPVALELVWADGAGWEVSKRLLFPATGHKVEVSMTATAPGQGPVFTTIGPGLNPGSLDSRNVYLRQGAVLMRAGEGIEQWDADDLDGPVVLRASYRWAAIESNYFLGAFLLERDAQVRLSRITVPAPRPPGGAANEGDSGEDDDEPATVDLVQLAVDVPGEGLDTTLFLGPKRYHDLIQEEHDLHKVVDFGIFGIIARPLLYVLVWIHSMVANYGVAIILLTVLLRLVFLPLNHKAMVSMRKTQSLQPQMAAIRAKYKGVKELEKKQKMNEEIMELYRREGVSPLGGCLPMLAQLPILFAFYSLLSVSIELRGAPFVLWIQDLSRHDPYLVLPLLMGATMLIQQRMAPTAGGNPAQARMMAFMPIIFTVMFLYVPSGLVLYWTTNNVLGIGQQVYINRTLDTPDAGSKGRGKGKKGKNAQRGKR